MSAGGRKKRTEAVDGGMAQPVEPVRLLVAGVGFLVYSAILILVFGDYFYEGVSSGIGHWGMIGAAALGYLLLGGLSRAPVSIVIGLLPPLLAWYVDPSIPAEAVGDPMPLYQSWLTWVYIFLPAWLVGLLGSRILIARREGNVRIR